MMELLAQSEGFPPEAVGVIVGGVLSALGVGGYAGKKWTEKRIRIEPNPLAVKKADSLVTTDDLDEVQSELKRRIAHVELTLSDERKIAREANGKLHGRIDKVAENVAGMRGEMGQLNQNLRALLDLRLNGNQKE